MIKTQKVKIKQLRKQGFTYKEISKMFSFSYSYVRQVCTDYKSPLEKPTKLSIKRSKKFNDWCKKNRINYKGNISHLTKMRNGTRERIRELVRIRDNHTCQECGKKWKKGERRLDVHHKDNDKEKTRKCDKLEETDNMVTLCHKCHLNLPAHTEAMVLRENSKKKLVNNSK